MENKTTDPSQDQNKLPDDLIVNPDGTAVFTIQEEGEVQGSYRGTFILKCYLNPMETLSAGRLFRDYLGPNGELASENDRFLAFALAQLQKRVIKGPPWWQVEGTQGNIPDTNILSITLDRAITAEAAFKARLKQKKDAALQQAQEALLAIQKKQAEDRKPISDKKEE